MMVAGDEGKHAAGQPPAGFGGAGGAPQGSFGGGYGAPPPGGFGAPPPGGFGQPPGFHGYPPPLPPQVQAHSSAILAMVLALLTFPTTCFPLGLVGLYLGAKARREARERGERDGTINHTFGLIAMIVGGVFGGLWGLFWLMELVIILFGVGAAFIPVLTGP